MLRILTDEADREALAPDLDDIVREGARKMLLSALDAEVAEYVAANAGERDYVYVWADGIHFNIRLEDDRLCCLVLIGVRGDGSKELIAVGDGFRESKDSWAELLRDLKRRGMRAPVLGIGDGALGFWAALREVYPETREQRC